MIASARNSQNRGMQSRFRRFLQSILLFEDKPLSLFEGIREYGRTRMWVVLRAKHGWRPKPSSLVALEKRDTARIQKRLSAIRTSQ